MSKKQISIRLDQVTTDQIKDLKRWNNSTQTGIIARAVERYHRERMETMTDYNRASSRVENTPELVAHAETILADWPEGDEHWQWVITAPVAEIVDWAETVEQQ